MGRGCRSLHRCHSLLRRHYWHLHHHCHSYGHSRSHLHGHKLLYGSSSKCESLVATVYTATGGGGMLSVVAEGHKADDNIRVGTLCAVGSGE